MTVATPPVAPGRTTEAAAVDGAEPAPLAPFHIESVRVDTGELDVLMTHAGELTVTRSRIERRLTELNALIDFSAEGVRRGDGRSAGSAGPDTGTRPAQLHELLLTLRTGIAEDSARLATITGELENGIHLMRLLPLSNVFRLFPRLVHDLGQEQRKEVELVIEGGDTAADKRILEEIKDPLMHMLRNAVDHGIESPQVRQAAGKPRGGTVRIKASQTASSVVIEVSDDGRGLDEVAIANAAAKRGFVEAEALATMNSEQLQSLIFSPGMSTAAFVTDVSGRGVGMGVVSANVARLRGSIRLQSTLGQGTTITIELPITVATVRVLIVAVNGHPYALPAECVQMVKMVDRSEIFMVEERDAILHRNQPVSVARLADLLELPTTGNSSTRNTPTALPFVLVGVGGESFGLFVDELLNEQEVVLKAHSALLERVRNVAGATILDTGEICMVLNFRDLLASMRSGAAPVGPTEVEAPAVNRKLILLAEDTITTRTQETRILEGAGYEVVATSDGLAAWNQLAMRKFDAVVTDINMPRLDGLGLTEKIRREPKYAELPIILVTSLASEEDQRRGLEAGANAYLIKSAFDQQTLLDCLERLL